MIVRRRLSDHLGGDAQQRRLLIHAQRGILEALQPECEPPELLVRAVQIAEHYVPDARAAILCRDRPADALSLGAAPSLSEDLCERLGTMPLRSAGPSSVTAVRRREPVWIPDIVRDTTSSRLHDAVREAGLRSVWSAPLMCNGGEPRSTIGALDLYFEDRVRLDDQAEEDLQAVSELVATIVDRYQAVQRSRDRSSCCPITGLPNRTSFIEELSRRIDDAGTDDQASRFGVALLDIDKFKEFNDALGFRVGDLLLRALAERLEGEMRSSDHLGRAGSDSFFILFSEVSTNDEIALVAEEILRLVNQPYDFGGHGLYVSASMGISVFPWDGEDAEALVRNAEAAVDTAKERGGGHFQLYHPTMVETRPTLESWIEQTRLGSELREALEHDQLELYYQPKVDALDDGRIAGAEALLRWRHPDLGILLPGQFLPLAERMGLLVEFGEWSIRQICRQATAWMDRGLPPMPLSVNISPVHFRRGKLLSTLDQSLRESGMAPECLEVEIVESLVMEDSRLNRSRLDDLHNLGIGIAVDDFGTGYSSLSYLSTFPFDTIKIDRTFIHDIGSGGGRDRKSRNVVRAILSLARTLSVSVVAEGVETEEQIEFLADNGCDLLQGYFFSKAVPAYDFTRLLMRQQRRLAQRSAS